MSVDIPEQVWGRIDKVEAWLEKLAEISVDLKSMLAVHEQRLIQVDKNHDYIEEMVEKRRVELDHRVDEIYNTMRNQDNKILDEIKSLREETSKLNADMSAKISKMERFVWMAIGGGMVFVWILSYIANYFKIMGH